MKGNVGGKIRELLKRMDMTQLELAEAIGTSESHMSRIIMGKAEPAYSKVEEIAEAMGVPMSALDEEEVAAPIIADRVLSTLPDDIRQALTDTRNRDWILLGLSMKDKTLSKEEIQIVLDSYARAKDTLSKGRSKGK